MPITRRTVVRGIPAAAALALAAPLSRADTWPTGPVRIIVPYGAGGATDAVARVFANYFQQIWGKPVVVENRPGASGNIGAALVAKAVPDGHTLLVGVSSMAAVSALFKKLPYDPLLDLQPVAGLISSPSLIVVNPDVPATTLRELVALAKQQPGKLNYGSTGVGSGGQLAFEYLNSLAGTDLTHVPYQGDAPLMPALMSNQVQAAVLQPTVAAPLIKAGKLRAIAVTTKARFSRMPDIPTIAEGGIAGYDYAAWIGLFAPAGTPASVVAKINADAREIMKNDDLVKNKLPTWSVDAWPIAPQEFKEQYMADVEKYKRIVQFAKIPQID